GQGLCGVHLSHPTFNHDHVAAGQGTFRRGLAADRRPPHIVQALQHRLDFEWNGGDEYEIARFVHGLGLRPSESSITEIINLPFVRRPRHGSSVALRRSLMHLKRAFCRWSVLVFLVPVVAGACARTPPPPPPPPPPAPAPPPPPSIVWTARPEVPVVTDSAAIALPYPFTLFDVIGRYSLGHFLVTCTYCPRRVSGSVQPEDVVYEVRAPAEAATGSLAEFALAIRDAAAWRRIDSL